MYSWTWRIIGNNVTTLKSNKQDDVQQNSLINSKKVVRKGLRQHQIANLSLAEQETDKNKNISTIKLVHKHIDN